VTDEPITISQRTRFQVAMILAIVADAPQLVFLPYSLRALHRLPKTSSMSVLELRCLFCLGGTGSFCHRSRPSSLRESI
jgi:hypothetical protein